MISRLDRLIARASRASRLMDAQQRSAALKADGNRDFSSGNYTTAIEKYSESLRVLDGAPNPEGLHILYANRAAAHLKLGSCQAALGDAEAAVAAAPGWAKAHFRRAAALRQLGRAADAAGAARRALELEPGSAEVRALLQQLEAAVGGGLEAPPPRRVPFASALLPPLLASAPWEEVPAADGGSENLLLLLHGLGDRPAAFARLARQLALPQTAALALGGPQQVPFSGGGRSWYTVFDGDFELIQGTPGEQRRTRSLAATVAALQALLAALEARRGWQPRRIHLLGFSQGGTVALELARQQQAQGQALGSCVAVAAALLPEQLAAGLGGGGGGGGQPTTGCPVLITRGSADAVVSQQAVEATAAALRAAHGMPVHVHSVAGKGHAMPQGPQEARQLMQFWAKHLGGRPSAGELGAAAGPGGPGQLLELRPGEASVELVRPEEGR